MPNQLKMSKIQSILALRQQGWSFARIARELGIHRQTVADHVREHSKPTEAPTGSEEPKPTEAPTGSVDSKPARAPRSSLPSGSGRSDCEPLREVIESKLDQGLHARRIYQDLVAEHGFAGSYWSVMRFVRRLGKARELPFRRMECEPGEEAQVDFGSGAPVVDRDPRYWKNTRPDGWTFENSEEDDVEGRAVALAAWSRRWPRRGKPRGRSRKADSREHGGQGGAAVAGAAVAGGGW